MEDQPGAVIPEDFAGLSFERGPLNPGNAGVAGYLFHPGNDSLVTLFRRLGLRNLRIGGGSVENMALAGTGRDGFTGIDNLFGFAAAAGVKVIYSLRLLNPAARPVDHLKEANARVAAYIWRHYQDQVASFAVGNEPDWHAFHAHPGHPFDPAIEETAPGVPGSAYPSYLATWRGFADAIREAAPGVLLAAPDTGAYTTLTYTPDPGSGVSWTQRFASDAGGPGGVADITQHYYVGGDPGRISARQAISAMLSPEWVHGTGPGTQAAGTTYIPYPWLYASNLAPVAAAGMRYRLTESNDYLTGVSRASDAFASALWALDYLHWWAAHGAAGVNFHNKQWLYTDTIIPDAAADGRYVSTPKGYAIKAFALGSAGRVKPLMIENPDGINLTAYGAGNAREDYVTVINKTQGAGAADAAVMIVPPGPASPHAEVMVLAGSRPGDATGSRATLGGAVITGGAPGGPGGPAWDPLRTGQEGGIGLTVRAATAAVVRIRRRG